MEDDTFFRKKKTVWEAVKEQLKPPEYAEVENAIGLQLINENESLRQELEGLEAMLQAFETEDDNTEEERLLPSQSQHDDLLHSQIRQFLVELQAARGEEGMATVIKSPKERAAADYVLSGGASARPGSSRSWERPSSARPRSAFTSHSAPEEVVKPLGAISAVNIERVLRPLRAALAAEKAMFEDEIETTRDALEAALGQRSEQRQAAIVPTTLELKELKSKLESEVHAETHRHATLQRLALPRSGSAGRNTLAPLPKLKPQGLASTMLPPRYPMGTPTPPVGTKSEHSPHRLGRRLVTSTESLSATLPLPLKPLGRAASHLSPSKASASPSSLAEDEKEGDTGVMPSKGNDHHDGDEEAEDDDEKWFRDDDDDGDGDHGNSGMRRGVSLGGLGAPFMSQPSAPPSHSDSPTTAAHRPHSRALRMRGEVAAARQSSLKYLEQFYTAFGFQKKQFQQKWFWQSAASACPSFHP